jgi:hypothetical protein
MQTRDEGRRPSAGLVGLATAALLAMSGAPAPAATATVPCQDPRGCPDLVVDGDTMTPCAETRTFPPGDCAVVEGMVQAGQRTLLRFTFTTPNRGRGDLIVGIPDLHPEWFEASTCHGHLHFREYADYRLWTPAGYAAWDALRVADPSLTATEVLAAHPELASQFVVGRKQGFCVIDVVPYRLRPPKYLVCDFQGISVGWADEYVKELDGQWVDVTGLAAGDYVLEAEVNAERLFEESSYANNRASNDVRLEQVPACD